MIFLGRECSFVHSALDNLRTYSLAIDSSVVRVSSNAKINIGLKVLGKRSDGYHDIETLIYPIPLFDNIVIERSDDAKKPFSMVVEGEELSCSVDQNSIFQMYTILSSSRQLPPIRVHLQKNIPAGSGLGGASSNGVSFMLALNRLLELKLSYDEMIELSSQLCSDCVFFVNNAPSLCSGRGEICKRVNLSLSGYTLALLLPDVRVSTKEAYKRISQRASHLKSSPSLELLIQAPISDWRSQITNDFEKLVFKLHPELAELKEYLYQQGAIYASLSGTGSAIFGLFEEYHDVKLDSLENNFRTFKLQL